MAIFAFSRFFLALPPSLSHSRSLSLTRSIALSLSLRGSITTIKNDLSYSIWVDFPRKLSIISFALFLSLCFPLILFDCPFAHFRVVDLPLSNHLPDCSSASHWDDDTTLITNKKKNKWISHYDLSVIYCYRSKNFTQTVGDFLKQEMNAIFFKTCRSFI